MVWVKTLWRQGDTLWAVVGEVEGVEGAGGVGEYHNGLGRELMEAGRHNVGCGGRGGRGGGSG